MTVFSQAACFGVTRKLRPDEHPASRSELVEDIGRKPLSPTLLDLMREGAEDEDD
ncbi:MAG: hypothetical protein ACTHLT_18960 [Devosia sp.]